MGFKQTATHRFGKASYHQIGLVRGQFGNVQEVREVFVDCDADTTLLKVHQVGGAACHEGYASCFFRKVEPDGLRVVGERVFDPKAVYKK